MNVLELPRLENLAREPLTALEVSEPELFAQVRGVAGRRVSVFALPHLQKKTNRGESE